MVKSAENKLKVNKFKVCALTAIMLSLIFVCAYLLYTNVLISAAAAGILALPVYKRVKKELQIAYENKIRKEFAACLAFISGSLASGLRLEYCIDEIALSDSPEFRNIRPEFIRMKKLVELNWPAEKAFEELARRIPSTDIKLFSLALDNGIPAGINLGDLIRNISAGMRVRNDTEAEISRTLNLPKYNNRIMMIMPFIMLAAIRKFSPGYLESLDSGIGGIIKTAAAVLIIISILLGEKIGDIDYAK